MIAATIGTRLAEKTTVGAAKAEAKETLEEVKVEEIPEVEAEVSVNKGVVEVKTEVTVAKEEVIEVIEVKVYKEVTVENHAEGVFPEKKK